MFSKEKPRNWRNDVKHLLTSCFPDPSNQVKMDALVNRPNTILARQKAIQADPRPVFLKTPRARLYLGELPGAARKCDYGWRNTR